MAKYSWVRRYYPKVCAIIICFPITFNYPNKDAIAYLKTHASMWFSVKPCINLTFYVMRNWLPIIFGRALVYNNILNLNQAMGYFQKIVVLHVMLFFMYLKTIPSHLLIWFYFSLAKLIFKERTLTQKMAVITKHTANHQITQICPRNKIRVLLIWRK